MYTDVIKKVVFVKILGDWYWEVTFENGDKVFKPKFNSLESAIQDLSEGLGESNEE